LLILHRRANPDHADPALKVQSVKYLALRHRTLTRVFHRQSPTVNSAEVGGSGNFKPQRLKGEAK